MGGRHFRTYDGHSFDFNIGRCRYVLAKDCDREESDPTVIIQQGQLYFRVTFKMEYWEKVKVHFVDATPLWTQNPSFRTVQMTCVCLMQ